MPRTKYPKAAGLVPGDIIVVEEGDHIPADARLIESRNVRTIEASLTGESLPGSKMTEPLLHKVPIGGKKTCCGRAPLGFFSNQYVAVTFLSSAIITVCIIQIEIFTNLFGFMALAFAEIAVMVLAASSVLWCGEFYKYVRSIRIQGPGVVNGVSGVHTGNHRTDNNQCSS